jgi:hypothetical protein
MKHRHHIIPKHAGGTDDESNIVLLSIEEHADAHRILYEKHNRIQDFVAWKMLSGQIGKEEAIALLISEGGKKGGRVNVQRNKDSRRGMWSEESTDKSKQRSKELGVYRLGGLAAGKKNVESGHLSRIAGLGGKGCKGLKWYHDPIHNTEANLRECPPGWIKGRLNKPSFPSSVLSNGKGSAWWHCPISRKSKMIKPGVLPPDGWVKGRA